MSAFSFSDFPTKRIFIKRLFVTIPINTFESLSQLTPYKHISFIWLDLIWFESNQRISNVPLIWINTSWQIVAFLCYWLQAGLPTWFVKIMQMITKLVNWSWISCIFSKKKNIKNKLFINELIFTALALFSSTF